MKYSTLTKAELEKSYMERMPHLDFGMVEAGLTRHEVDWLYGINLSRALIFAANRFSRRYDTLSTGRVQGPTLRFLVARERSINSFVPTPYWSILAEANFQGEKYPAEYEKKKITKKADADAVVEACNGKTGQIEKIEEKTVQIPPPVPFDLGALQREAYRLFGYTPHRTSAIAERLYLEALISYPRTSSQKLPPVIGYKNILSGLSHEPAYQKLATELLKKGELRPRQGSREDPAHPAVYPTGNTPTRALEESERKIWDLVVRRFLAVFGDFAVKQSMKASINVNGHHFFLHGINTLKEGWMHFYEPYLRIEEVLLPPIREGDTIRLENVRREDKFTQPPPRYNPSSLLKKMEKEGIGTKATRAEIIDTLYKRKYITEGRIAVTDLGFNVIEVLHKYAPSVVSVELTRDLEEKMNRILSNSERRESVVSEAIERLEPVLAELKHNEESIGEVLSRAIQKARMQERVIGECPTCHTGKLMMLYSRKTGKRFIGCTNYQNSACKTYPLPQLGTVKPTGKVCQSCGWSLLLVYLKGRRPWSLCFNPNCPKKEEKRKRLEMQSLQSRNMVQQ
jgi:DNA topoisomerase-1